MDFKGVMSEAMTLKIQHGFMDWFKLQTQVSWPDIELSNRKGGSYLWKHFKISQKNDLDSKG